MDARHKRNLQMRRGVHMRPVPQQRGGNPLIKAEVVKQVEKKVPDIERRLEQRVSARITSKEATK